MGWPLCLFVFAMRVVSLQPSTIAGDAVAVDTVVANDAIEKSVEEIGKTTWFDPESRSLVPVPMKPADSDTVHRSSRWLPGAQKVAKAKSTSTPSQSPWLPSGWTMGNLVGWAILAILFVMAAALVLYAFSKIDPNGLKMLERSANARNEQSDEQLVRRIQELPVELRRTDVDLRSEAERLMNLGELDEAIKCLFGHQLLLLDQRGFLRLSRGKTNGRYVMETRNQSSECAELLRETANVFEASYFGNRSPEVARLDSLWQGNQQLERLSQPKSEVVG
jgi:hypothetical protein